MEELTLRPKKSKMLKLILLCIFFIALGILILILGGSGSVIAGTIMILIFGAGAVILLANMMPNGSYLKLSQEGFELKASFRKSFFKWDDIQKFYVSDPSAKMGIKSANFVVFDFSNSYGKQELAREIARSIGGSEGALPEGYGKSPEELAELMNSWKKKFSKNK